MPTSRVTPGVDFQKSPVVEVAALDHDDQNPEHDGRHRGPAEPPQRAPGELVEHVVARRAVHLGVRRGLDEVEEPEQTHPHHGDDHVGGRRTPPRDRLLLKISIGTPGSVVRAVRNVPKSDGIVRVARGSALGVRAPPREQRGEIAVAGDRVREQAPIGDGPPHRGVAVGHLAGEPTRRPSRRRRSRPRTLVGHAPQRSRPVRRETGPGGHRPRRGRPTRASPAARAEGRPARHRRDTAGQTRWAARSARRPARAQRNRSDTSGTEGGRVGRRPVVATAPERCACLAGTRGHQPADTERDDEPEGGNDHAAPEASHDRPP